MFRPMATINFDYLGSTDDYSDGESEQELLGLFRDPESGSKISEILKDPSWPMRYHLSEVRKNLLSWYPFRRGSNVLEVGAGCGALTGLLCDRAESVTAVELTKMRAEILHARHESRSNLEIYAGNLKAMQFEKKFDYVTCIGVLEYAGRFSGGDEPYAAFLQLLRSYMRSGGTLVLAIENKFGLKYWAGAKEDHTGRAYESIENYPNRQGVATFSKPEISELLLSNGFTKLQFFYPQPDYKLPTEIFSDQYLPTTNHNLRAGLFPFVDHSNKRDIVFNEMLANQALVESKMFDFFANSFLIFAGAA